MLKLALAAKSSGASYLNKSWTIIVMAVALGYSALTLTIGNPFEKRGLTKK